MNPIQHPNQPMTRDDLKKYGRPNYVAPGNLDGSHPADNALDIQVAGSHYKEMKIQPVEFIHANGIPFIEGCAIKYLCRWRKKGGVADLKKARHFIDLLIDLEVKGE